MRRKVTLFLFALVVLGAAATNAAAQGMPAARRDSVLAAVRRGWEAIRAQADSLAGMEGLMRISRGAVSMILERVGGAWKVLHDHFSLPLPEGS